MTDIDILPVHIRTTLPNTLSLINRRVPTMEPIRPSIDPRRQQHVNLPNGPTPQLLPRTRPKRPQPTTQQPKHLRPISRQPRLGTLRRPRNPILDRRSNRPTNPIDLHFPALGLPNIRSQRRSLRILLAASTPTTPTPTPLPIPTHSPEPSRHLSQQTPTRRRRSSSSSSSLLRRRLPPNKRQQTSPHHLFRHHSRRSGRDSRGPLRRRPLPNSPQRNRSSALERHRRPLQRRQEQSLERRGSADEVQAPAPALPRVGGAGLARVEGRLRVL